MFFVRMIPMSAWIDEFPHNDALRYLNHAAVAPWPRRTSLAVAAFAQENVAQGAKDYPAWLEIEQRLRERLMRLLNAPSTADIALVKNTSEALSFVAFGLNWKAGDEIIISDEEFPSNRIVWEALSRFGVEVVEVSLTGNDPEQSLIDACNSRTRLMAISAVQYAGGLRLDLIKLGQGCRQKNVLLCVDAIQQLGALPLDVQACDCAFAMADGHKWMLGPEGLGVFYCRSDLREQLTLNEYGWHMLDNAGDYNSREWRPARTARRFECGSPNMLGAVALESSLSLLEEVGMDNVANQLQGRIQILIEGVQSIQGAHIHSVTDIERRAGILTFTLERWKNTDLFEALKGENIICAQRGAGIRLSPHFYTTEQVLDTTLDTLRRFSSR
jgi:selenocysteine lyase/cysteine desulfurase